MQKNLMSGFNRSVLRLNSSKSYKGVFWVREDLGFECTQFEWDLNRLMEDEFELFLRDQ